MTYRTVGLACRDHALKLIRRLVSNRHEFGYCHVESHVLKHHITTRADLDDPWIWKDLDIVDLPVPPPYGENATAKTPPPTYHRRPHGPHPHRELTSNE